MDVNKITKAEIKEAISRSGYLIERRVSTVLSSNYFVRPNHTYLDPISEKTREIDLKADSTLMWTEEFYLGGIHCSIICECENNTQPIIFFPFKPLMPIAASSFIKCLGMPMKIWKDNNYEDIVTYLPFHKFHHYCKGNCTTQYCSFIKRKDKGKWFATHLEEQHDTFNSLVYSGEYEIDEFYKDYWQPPEKDEKEPVLIQLIYPLVVLGGDLMEAYVRKRQLVIKKVKHTQYINKLYISGREAGYIIDVITEDYLNEYVKIIEYEVEKLKNLVRRHRRIIQLSIDRIIEDVKNSEKPDSYRKLLTTE